MAIGTHPNPDCVGISLMLKTLFAICISHEGSKNLILETEVKTTCMLVPNNCML